MPDTEEPFNWRTFWADLLQGSGRALLALDGSDEAQAAMIGLDYFDAARDRQVGRVQNATEDDHDRTSPTEVGPRRERGWETDIFRSPYSHWESLWSNWASRPRPMSANPYDVGGLPAQVSFPPTGLPVIRRR